MTKEEIKEIFNNPSAECNPNWCRDRKFENDEAVLIKQSKEFREFWYKKILYNSYVELSESDMDRVILFFDSTARDSKEFKESGGISAAKANIRRPQWHKALRDLKHKQDIKEILNQIFIEKDDNIKIDLLNKLERINQGRGNGLTSKGAVILNALLFTYTPEKYLTMLLLAHRFAFMNFFSINGNYNYQTYGEKIIKSNNNIIVGFKEKYEIDTTPFGLSFFAYCQLEGNYNYH